MSSQATLDNPVPAATPHPRPAHGNPGHTGVIRWLWAVWGLIGLMVVVGGITRLTGSGLSMVDWRPLMGALPPIGEAEWLAVFEQYKQSPQYQQVNHWMGLADFKRIFFWEYIHRLLGRFIGVAFAVPFVWFAVRRQLRGRLAVRTSIAFVLGGLQGLLGWYMVKSGLVDVPEVSHLRLAAHLGLAFFVSVYVLHIILDLTAPPGETGHPARLRVWGWVALGLLAVQIVWGAFMAGTDAGWLYATFPTMNGAWVPAFESIVSDPAGIHFAHRTLGYLVAAVLIGWAIDVRRTVRTPRAGALAMWVGLGVVAQFLLGVATVVLNVPTSIAVAHQLGAFLLLAAAVATQHALRVPR